MAPGVTTTLITGIAQLVTNDPGAGDGSPLGIMTNAAVVIDGSSITWIGPASRAPGADICHDIDGRCIVPGFVDSHTHVAFSGDRVAEFTARMCGGSYDGGGITTTVTATRSASDSELRTLLARRLVELRSQGTTTAEIKSGYGLTVADEVRLLRLIREFSEEATYLGAHVIPSDSGRDEYLELVTGEMLEACAPYAKWIDVFCEPASPHAFDADEARIVLLAGQNAGLGLRVHANQLSLGPGVLLAVELGAASADHCTHLSKQDVDALASGTTVATLLPGVEFATRSIYPDGRRLLDAEVTVALATDCNPGTSYTSSMPFVIALAVREMGMTPAEAIWAATAGGAKSLRRDDIGVLRIGCRADLALIDGPSYEYLAYRPGVPIASTFSEGNHEQAE